MDAEKILAGLQKLVRENDNHWTQDGKPRLEAVRLLAGDQSLSREDIDAAAPGFSRQQQAASEGGDQPLEQNTSAESMAPLEAAKIQEHVDAAAGTIPPAGDAPSALQPESAPEAAGKVEAAQRRLDVARQRKKEADQEFTTAQAELDALIVAGEIPEETFSEQYQRHQKAQQERLAERARQIEALKGIDLKAIIPRKAPIDQAYARKNGRGTQRPGS